MNARLEPNVEAEYEAVQVHTPFKKHWDLIRAVSCEMLYLRSLRLRPLWKNDLDAATLRTVVLRVDNFPSGRRKDRRAWPISNIF